MFVDEYYSLHCIHYPHCLRRRENCTSKIVVVVAAGCNVAVATPVAQVVLALAPTEYDDDDDDDATEIVLIDVGGCFPGRQGKKLLWVATMVDPYCYIIVYEHSLDS